MKCDCYAKVTRPHSSRPQACWANSQLVMTCLQAALSVIVVNPKRIRKVTSSLNNLTLSQSANPNKAYPINAFAIVGLWLAAWIYAPNLIPIPAPTPECHYWTVQLRNKSPKLACHTVCAHRIWAKEAAALPPKDCGNVFKKTFCVVGWQPKQDCLHPGV
mgnify:CR=1 FL=1